MLYVQNSGSGTRQTTVANSSNTARQRLNQEQWKSGLYRGLPAIIVAAVAIALIGYGRWILPTRLPDRYARLLEEYRLEYADADKLDDAQLLRLASSMDICFSRLDAYGKDSGSLWSRVEFLGQHTRTLKQRLLRAEEGALKEALEKQLGIFQDKHQKLIENLASDGSPHTQQANVWLVDQMLRNGFSLDQADAMIDRLEGLNAADPNDSYRSALADLYWERVWQVASEQGRLPPPIEELHKVQEQLSAMEPADAISPLRMELQLQLAPQAALSAIQALPPADAEVSILDEDAFRLAVLKLAAEGDWLGLRALLASSFSEVSAEELSSVRTHLTRMILRPFFGALAKVDSGWCEESPKGLQLALELAPTVPEIMAFVWQLACQHAGREVTLSEELLETILTSESSQRYVVLALSNALRGNSAANYLSFASSRDPSAIPRLAHIALWRTSLESQDDDQALLSLLKEMASVEENATTWLALTRIQIRAEDYPQAASSLSRLEKILGEKTEVTRSLQKVIDANLSRMTNLESGEIM